ncbi:alpha/beta fold hydrolase [Tunicatimonas pelagia]|uniref:alpha/beta fold hydrolase n=1 Tax=Tunicatimonas pelagia TaxID=931531 RepID=UPI002665F5A1|nr:alpha/beta hydrolase [Tunicatimonas pelagia]WKN44821.1 alpha/beta hydrolase [Tunicatimonas pelagia]
MNKYIRHARWALIVWVFFACSEDEEVAEVPQAAIDAALPAAVPPTGFTSQVAQVNGIDLHYVTGGQGDPLLLIHGWPQSWYEWHRVMPTLGQQYTLIVPDLRGIGGSDNALLPDGYSKKLLAEDLHALVQQLGYTSVKIIGHDIGLMVGYAYASEYPEEVEKMVLMDAPLPGIEPFWTGLLQDPRSWHFGFYADGDAAVDIIGSDIRSYLIEFYQKFAFQQDAFSEEEIDEFARVYSQPGALRSSLDWYKGAYRFDIEDNQLYSQTKLQMPILALGGEYSGSYVLPMIQSVADNVSGGIIANSGHWIVEEQPQAFLDQVIPFLAE